MGSSPSAATPWPERWSWWLLFAASAAAAVGFGFAVSQRVGYPHELEWMEGAMVDHCHRVANGLPLYCEPSPEHVPFLYAPLQFWLGGAAVALGVDGLLALRVLATVATCGCAWLIGAWVAGHTGRRAYGVVAAGLFVAGYGWLSFWFDLARNDTLFLGFVLGACWQLAHGGPRRWLVAAVLATCAGAAKQTALSWLPAIAVGALCLDWRIGWRFAVATAVGLAMVFGVLHVASDGWSSFYLFEMPGYHPWIGSFVADFWRVDMLPQAPLLGLGLLGFVRQWRSGGRGGALFLAAFGSGALVASWLSRLHVGGFDNVLMYAFAAACVLGPIAVASAGGRSWALGLLVLQFALLAHEGWLRRDSCLPSPQHRHAHDELAAFVGSRPGPVWVVGHGGIAARAGKGGGAHGMAIIDLTQLFGAELSPRATTAIGLLATRTAAAIAAQQFAAIVVDAHGLVVFEQFFHQLRVGADGRPDTADDAYVLVPGSLLTEPAALRPPIGGAVHSPYGLVPRR
jgi:hypothetical protein